MKQAIKNYEETLQTGLKLQEQSAKWWTDCLAQAGANADWQKSWKATANQTIPIIQKRMEESLRLVEQGSRTSVELLKQALAVAASDSTAAAQAKLQELWTASLEASRNNAQAVSQANGRFIESLVQLFPNAAEPTSSKSKAA
jgi:hypothetical protein